jgi:hypothetical protein
MEGERENTLGGCENCKTKIWKNYL